MSELLSKLGIDGKLLLSQAVNFLILLWVLRTFAYRPLLKIMKERRTKIEEGLEKAREADNRLLQANEMMKEKVKEAENEALLVMKRTEEKARKTEAELLVLAHQKEAEVLEGAERAAKAKEEEAAERLRAEAAGLIKKALVAAVNMKPEQVDETLIAQAVEKMELNRQ